MTQPLQEPAPIPILDLDPELAEVGSALDAAWRRVRDSGHFILGPEVDAFEREVAVYLGVRHAIGVNSGTDAIVLGLRALGIGPGDDVIVPTFTFFATAESVSAVGATPVFVDVDPITFAIRAEQVEGALTPRTKAIIPVHLFGHAADMAPLLELSARTGIPLLEDVAQAFGATWRGRKLGTLGRVGAFSFFPSKNLGCLGDGGLVVTDDAAVADAARMLRAHGSRRKYYNEAIGYNSRLDALQAAFLRVKLPHVDAWNRARWAAAERYRQLLGGLPEIVLPSEQPDAHHVYHQYTIRVRAGRRDAAQAALAAAGIGTMVYYPKNMHELPVYAPAQRAFPDAELASREVLSLPMWPRIEADAQARVAGALRAFLT